MEYQLEVSYPFEIGYEVVVVSAGQGAVNRIGQSGKIVSRRQTDDDALYGVDFGQHIDYYFTEELELK
jgi:hypothetical protein